MSATSLVMGVARVFRRVGPLLACLSVLLWILLCLRSLPAQAEDYTKRDLQGRSFAGQDITHSTFLKANLRDSDLSGVYGVGVNLFGTNLSRANLQGADLRAATLDMANLRGADLRGAILENSMMWLAQVDQAQIEGADFTDALLRKDTLATLCETASGINPTTGRETRETLECD